MNRFCIRKIFVAMVLSSTFALANSQNMSVKTSIDSTSIYIGDQTLLHLDLQQDKGDIIQLPYFADTITNGIQVIKTGKPDTVDMGNNRIQVKLDYLITSFDSGLYYIPPFPVIKGQDTVWSNDLGLKVMTFNVEDTTHGAFFDIKPVYKAPFVFSDYLYILWSLLALAAIILIIIYARKQLKKRKEGQGSEIVVPLLPADVEALQALEQVKNDKLWQNGREKEYYTRITDALRRYLERRFGIFAMEMTTSEIMSELKRFPEAKEVQDQLRSVFETADFVKFAKMRPIADENELNLSRAMIIVNKTKVAEEKEPAEEKEETSKSANE